MTHTCVSNSSILFQAKNHFLSQWRSSRYQLWKKAIHRMKKYLKWLKYPANLQIHRWHLSKEFWNLFSVGQSLLIQMQACLITCSHCQPGKVRFCWCERKYSSFWWKLVKMKMSSRSRILLLLFWEMQDSYQTSIICLSGTTTSSKQLARTQMARTQWTQRNQTTNPKTSQASQ